jgi:hypothetical protein
MMPPVLPTALALTLLLLPSPAVGAPLTAAQDTSTLQFRGFRAGARLAELDAALRRGGRRLRCERATRDPRVSECVAAVSDSALGPMRLWVSAIDSLAGVITLSASMDAASLARWRGELERRYGRVPARAQGSQRMMQWVRRGRMLRLTWRVERSAHVASVSLVDGRVLDGWGARRSAPSP